MKPATDLHRQSFNSFTAFDHETWRMLFSRLAPHVGRQAHPVFLEGLAKLGFTADRIPDLEKTNAKLKALTGWTAVPVEGLEAGKSFYPALARREFPIGNFIRDRGDLGYTPAPDVFHDLYGHVPFFTDGAYADFCQAYGELSLGFVNDPVRLRMIERFFWFTIEFGLAKAPVGTRIFGGGILSSHDESFYALSGKPEIQPFDVEAICSQEFRIDIVQPRLFLLDSVEQLYASLARVADVIGSAGRH